MVEGRIGFCDEGVAGLKEELHRCIWIPCVTEIHFPFVEIIRGNMAQSTSILISCNALLTIGYTDMAQYLIGT